MAEAVLFNIAEQIILKFGSLALEEFQLARSAKDDLQKLVNTISFIKGVLLDAEEQRAHNHTLKLWLRNLEDAVYDADNLLDEFATETLRKEVLTKNKTGKKVRIFFSKSNQIASSFKLAHRIKAIKEKLDAIAADRTKFNLTDRFEDRRHKPRTDTHSFVLDENVIGRDVEKKKIVELVLDENVRENITVIPIVGLGGMGKTTLAKYMFNDMEVQNHFDLRLWVCVSDPFDIKMIVASVVESATKERPKNDLGMDSLQSLLRKEINGKKYLLVLDDVWNEDRQQWLNLKELLEGGFRGSKIVITSRSERVAKVVGTVDQPFLLRGLSVEDSWRLFIKMAFREGREPENLELVAIGKEILKKCSGVPQAIKTIGKMLYQRDSEYEWLEFKDKEISKIKQKEDDILPILKLSYDHLPYNLKHCFAYCSLFPKDHWIYKNFLIKMWMAQGFIQSSDGRNCLEAIGEEYFMDLSWGSFFQGYVYDDTGNIYAYAMHDLMHDLAESVVGDNCVIADLHPQNVTERTRHVSFTSPLSSSWQIPNHLLKAKKLQTFLSLHDPTRRESQLRESILNQLFTNFKILRILGLSDLDIREVPNSIGLLKHLRYLDLSENQGIEKLPSSIKRLQNLQTLNLEYCTSLRKLPKDTRNLISLRHLNIDGCEGLSNMPYGLGQLTSLQTLPLFVLEKKESSRPGRNSGLIELKELNNLRGRLRIKNLQYLRNTPWEGKAANLEMKQHLTDLDLFWDHKADDAVVANEEELLAVLQPHPKLTKLRIAGYGSARLPCWVAELLNLVEVYIKDCKWCQHLPPLHHLPSLKTLSLRRLPDLEYIGIEDKNVSSTAFPSLEKLFLFDLPNLKGWWKSETVQEQNQHHMTFDLPSFSKLSTFYLYNCPKLTSIPPYPNLRKLLLGEVREKVLRQVITKAIDPTLPSSSSYSPHSNLDWLVLRQVEDLESISDELLRSLSYLEDLTIEKCHKLRMSLPQILQHLPKLRWLTIYDCEEFDLVDCNADDGVMKWNSLSKLFLVRMKKLPRLLSLPEGLQHATSLQCLEIKGCHNLTALPEWIGTLTSLQRLEIVNCSNIASLPEGIQCLTSLRELRIAGCPHLKERCQPAGDDWPKISHIQIFDQEIYPYDEKDDADVTSTISREPASSKWRKNGRLNCFTYLRNKSKTSAFG